MCSGAECSYGNHRKWSHGHSDPGISTQGVKFDEELLGSERDSALQQALEDWKVQGVRAILESEGKQLELGGAQAFSFERGSHEGTVVLLPFGDRLLSYMQFRDHSLIILTVHQSSAAFRAISEPQERNDLLKEMQDHGAFQWLEEELNRRGRALVPGLTILLKEDSRGQVVFFVFTKPKKVNSAEVFSQIVLLDPGVDGDSAGSYDTGLNTTSTGLNTTSASIPSGSENGGGGGGTVILSGFTDVVGSVSHSIGFGVIHASIKANGTHTSVTNAIVAKITVSGSLTFSGATPSPPCSLSNFRAVSATCTTSLTALKDIPIFGCTILNATGKSTHSYSDATKTPSFSSTLSSGNFTFTFNC